MTETLRTGGHPASPVRESGRFRKGCNPYAQTGRSKLQSQRVTLNQQIIKAMRLRAGAENLLRATDNSKVRDMVMLELSFVNSNLQLLKEELEGLNGSVEVYQNEKDALCFPLIPLGLKETKEVDFVTPIKDFIQEHYSEDPAEYEDKILDVMDMRQAVRTPSRNGLGVELLMSYYNQLNFMENRFFQLNRHLGLFFTWYDSFTGVPVCQQHLSLEKASILFNIGALYTQMGTRSDRRTQAGLESAIDAFQKAAGVLSHLKETFTHTPSFDMSPSMQNMLIRLMLAQAQECAFEKMVLPGIRNQYFNLLQVAQEAARVSDVYSFINQSITQAPIKEHVPPAWSYTVQVKLEHYRALAHYFMAIAMLDHQLNARDDADQQEMLLSKLYDSMPDGLAPLSILQSKEERKRVGKAHLRKAIMGQEEAMRVQNLCKPLRKNEILQEILRVSHKRSLTKYSEHDQEDDFDMMNAPNIIAKSDQKIEVVQPQFSKVKVVDFFHKLGPLSVFSAKQKWTAPRKIHLMPGDQDQGFTLQGESAVQVMSLDPTSGAARSGLRDGDIIVSVAGKDCKWNSVSEVIKMLKEIPEDGRDIQVISLQGLETVQLPKCATYYGGLPKTYSLTCLTLDDGKSRKGKKVVKKLSFLNWGIKNTKKTASTVSLPSAVDSSPQQVPDSTAHFRDTSDGSSLY
ncbi:rhophilin-2 [Carcharodon carcharias]|uniref:rhophilin-2 n=1 Tax=Carcharodon carcharias TaxID=13397 RepID=UPI001B7EDFAC|nr:rhophilin-2 [Carcharodon carcharias]